MQTRFSDEYSVCLSVRPSVCLSNVCIVTKWKKDLALQPAIQQLTFLTHSVCRYQA